MQDATEILESIAAFGGDDYILKGCVDSGSSTTAGFIVLNGIVMPFLGGANQPNIKIVETTTNIVVGAGNRDETTFHAEFGDTATPGYEFVWADVSANRFSNLVDITNKLSDTGWIDCVEESPVFNSFDIKARKRNEFVVVTGSFDMTNPGSVEIFSLPVGFPKPDRDVVVFLSDDNVSYTAFMKILAAEDKAKFTDAETHLGRKYHFYLSYPV